MRKRKFTTRQLLLIKDALQYLKEEIQRRKKPVRPSVARQKANLMLKDIDVLHNIAHGFKLTETDTWTRVYVSDVNVMLRDIDQLIANNQENK